MTMRDILGLNGWEGTSLNYQYEDSDLKYLNEKASILHTTIENANETLINGSYSIDTLITGVEKDNDYALHILIQYNDDKSKHKNNSHREEIHI